MERVGKIKTCNAMVKTRGRTDIEKILNKNIKVYRVKHGNKNKFYRQCTKKRYKNSVHKYCKTHDQDDDVVDKNEILGSDKVETIENDELDLYFSEKRKKPNKNVEKDIENALNLKKSKSVENIVDFKPDLNFKITKELQTKIEKISNFITNEPLTDDQLKEKPIEEVQSKYDKDVDSDVSSSEGEEVISITAKNGKTFVYRNETLEVFELNKLNPNSEALANILGILTVVSDKNGSINRNGKQCIISVNITSDGQSYHMDHISKRCYQKNIKSEKLVYCGDAIETDGIIKIVKKTK
jgi:competence protein ComGC